MNKNSLTHVRPLLILFVLLTGVFVSAGRMLTARGVDKDVLVMGNLLLVVVTLVSFYVLYRGVRSTNPQAFIRGMYGSFIVKFFVIAIAAFIYIRVAGKEVNKPALFICMGLYLLYTFIEVSILTRLLRKEKKNV